MENVLALPCQGPLGTANEEEPPSVDGAQRWPQTEATGDASNGKGKHDEAEQGMLHTNRIGNDGFLFYKRQGRGRPPQRKAGVGGGNKPSHMSRSTI